MTDLAIVAFWTCVSLILYGYLLYPIIVSLLARIGRPLSVHASAVEMPRVSVLISIYNEGRVLPSKLKNISETAYPADRIEFLLGSDGSTDRSNALIGDLHLPNVCLHAFVQRRGKIAVLNDLVQRAEGEILVFSDANTIYEPETIRRLVAPFADPEIGAVCGELRLRSTDEKAADTGESVYWNYENRLKLHESRYWTQLGATGGVYAMRKSLYRPLSEGSAIPDDFLIPLQALREQKRIWFAPEAVAWEDPGESVAVEFHRRVRIGAQNFRSIPEFGSLLHPREGFVAFALWSHKILRWCVPFLLLAIAVLTIPLATTNIVFQFMAAGEAVFVLMAAGAAILHGFGLPSGILRYPLHFLAMNFALLLGFFRFLKGQERPTWESARQTPG